MHDCHPNLLYTETLPRGHTGTSYNSPSCMSHAPPAPTGFNNYAEPVFSTGAASPFSPPSEGHKALLWSSLPKAFQDLRLKATPLLRLTQPLPSQSTPNFTAIYLQSTNVQSLRTHSLLHQIYNTKYVWQTPLVLRPELCHVSVQFKNEKRGLNILQQHHHFCACFNQSVLV